MNSWTCDGVPKNGQQYLQAIPGGHPEKENYGPDCDLCGLPREAMEGPAYQTTTVSAGSKRSLPAWPWLLGLLLVAMAGGWMGYWLLKSPPETSVGPTPSPTVSPSPADFVSSNAKNSQLFSQGEKILLRSTPEKEAGSQAFSQKDWEKAIADFSIAATPKANDPEAKIYFQNAQARKVGNQKTIAVVVPISSDANGSQEVLRGVAKYQEEYNQSQPAQPLEVVIANDVGQLKTPEIAEDLLQSNQVLGVIGHGIDPFSQQAISRYQDGGLAVLSSLTTSITEGGQPTLRTIALDDKNNELLANYLQAVAATLSQYARQQHSPPAAVIFYNSDSPYSQQLHQELVKALASVQGRVIEAVDITAAGFAGEQSLENAKKQGANVMFLALSRDTPRLETAIALAQANRQSSSPLLMLGGNELYNPDTLIQGGDGISGLILAVPWSFQAGDPFAEEAIRSWRGRVSWRTATAYDATQTLAKALEAHLDRAGVKQALSQGVPLTGSVTNFQIFHQVPLVKAVPGPDGPPGSKYQFEPIP